MCIRDSLVTCVVLRKRPFGTSARASTRGDPFLRKPYWQAHGSRVSMISEAPRLLLPRRLASYFPRPLRKLPNGVGLVSCISEPAPSSASSRPRLLRELLEFSSVPAVGLVTCVSEPLRELLEFASVPEVRLVKCVSELCHQAPGGPFWAQTGPIPWATLRGCPRFRAFRRRRRHSAPSKNWFSRGGCCILHEAPGRPRRPTRAQDAPGEPRRPQKELQEAPGAPRCSHPRTVAAFS